MYKRISKFIVHNCEIKVKTFLSPCIHVFFKFIAVLFMIQKSTDVLSITAKIQDLTMGWRFYKTLHKVNFWIVLTRLLIWYWDDNWVNEWKLTCDLWIYFSLNQVVGLSVSWKNQVCLYLGWKWSICLLLEKIWTYILSTVSTRSDNGNASIASDEMSFHSEDSNILQFLPSIDFSRYYDLCRLRQVFK